MKRLKAWLQNIFDPEQDINVAAVAEALNDASVRRVWLGDVLTSIRAMHVEVDQKLLNHNDVGLSDLCARRKAYQDILEAVLTARRTVTQELNHNPKIEIPRPNVNLDRVTE